MKYAHYAYLKKKRDGNNEWKEKRISGEYGRSREVAIYGLLKRDKK